MLSSSYYRQIASTGQPVKQRVLAWWMPVLAWLLMVCGGALVAADPAPHQRPVYVPWQELSGVPFHERQWVSLDRMEYERLKQLSDAEAAEIPPGGVTGVIQQQAVVARRQDEQLLVTLTVQLNQFTRAWQAWSIPRTGALIEKVQLDGQPALARSDNGDVIEVFSSGRGLHELKLELSLPLVATGADRLVTIPLPGAAVGELEIDVPAGMRLLVGGTSSTRPAPLDQSALYRIPVGGHNQVQLHLTTRNESRGPEALIFGSTGYGLRVTPGEVTWAALTTLQVYGQALDRLICQVPSTLEIADVSAPGLAGWTIADAADLPGVTELTLTFREPFDGQRAIQLRGVMAAPTGAAWIAPVLQLKGVDSHVGQIVLKHHPSVRLRIDQATGVRRASTGATPTSAMPEGPDAPAQMSIRFDFWKPDFVLQVTTEPKSGELQTALAGILAITPTHLELLATTTLSPRIASLFEVDLDVPGDWVPVSLQRDGAAVSWRTTPLDGGRQRLQVLLNPPVVPGAQAVLAWSFRNEPEEWPPETQPRMIALPKLSIPQSTITEATFDVRTDADFQVGLNSSVGLDQRPSVSAEVEMRLAARDNEYAAQLEVVRRQSNIAVESVVVARLDRTSAHLFQQSTLQILGGSTRELLVHVPAELGSALQFKTLFGPAIVEQAVVTDPEGVSHWRLRLAQRWRGPLVISVEMTLPRDAATSWTVPLWNVKGVDREQVLIAVEAAGDQRLSVSGTSAEGKPLAELDAFDLPPLAYAPRERIITVLRSVAAGASVILTDDRFNRLGVPAVVCQEQTIQSVLGSGGVWQHSARFQVQMSGAQSLAVELDAEAVLWSILLDGQPVEVRRAGTQALVTLAGNSDPSVVHELVVTYGTESNGQTSGRYQPVAPGLLAVTGTGGQQVVPVISRKWEVTYPETSELTGVEGAYEPVGTLRQLSWLGRWQDMARIPDWKESASRLGVLLGIVLCGVILGLLYRGLGLRGCVVGGLVTLILPVGFLSFGLLLGGCGQESSYALKKNAMVKSSAAPGAAAPMSEEFYGDQFESGQRGSRTQFESSDEPAAAKDLPPMNAPMSPPADGLGYRIQQRGAVFENLGDATLSLSDELSAQEMESKSLSDAEAASEVDDSRFRSALGGAILGGVLAREKQNQELAEEAQDWQAPAGPAAAMGGDIPPAVQFGDKLANVIQRRQDAQENAPQQANGRGDKAEGFGLGLAARAKGLLSLVIPLATPEGTRTQVFRYVGASMIDTGPGALQVQLVSKRTYSLICACAAMVVLLCGWLTRKFSWRWRCSLVLSGLLLPTALAASLPDVLQPVLDGLLLGTAGLVVLWLVWQGLLLADRVVIWSQQFSRWSLGLSTVRSMLLIIASSTAISGSAMADEVVVDSESQAIPATSPSVPGPIQVIPYLPGENPTTSERIALSYEQFLKLYQAANPPASETIPSPLTASVVEALYTGSVVEASALKEPNAPVAPVLPVDSALPTEVPPAAPVAKADVVGRFQARLVIQSTSAERALVPLPWGEVSVLQATLNGKPAVLLRREGRVELVVASAGIAVLDVVFAVPAKQIDKVGSLTVPLLPVATGKMQFQLPSAELSARVNGSSTTFRRRTEAGQASIEFGIDRSANLNVEWQPEQVRATQQVIAHVDSTSWVSLTDLGTQVTSHHAYKVRQGGLSELQLAIPQQLRLRTVSGPNVSGWEVIETPETNRVLRVVLDRSITDTTFVELAGYREQVVTEVAEAWSFLPTGPVDATTEVGAIGVSAAAHFSVRVEKLSGVTQTELNRFQWPTASPPETLPVQVAVRYSRRPAEVVLRTARLEPLLSATSEHGIRMVYRKSHLASRFLLNLTGQPRSTLSIALPKDFLLLDVQVADLGDWYLGVQDGQRVVTIELTAPHSGQLEVLLQGSSPRDPNASGINLEVPAVLGSTRSEHSLAVWFAEGESGVLSNSGRWRTVDPSQLPPAVLALAGGQLGQPELGFVTSQVQPTPLELTLQRAESQQTGATLTMTTHADVSTDFTIGLSWKLDRVPVDQFTLLTSDWLAGRLEFRGHGLRSTRHEPAGPGLIRWIISLDGPIRDSYFATATATFAPSAGQLVPPVVQLQSRGRDGQYRPLALQRHFSLLINLSESVLTRSNPDVTNPVHPDDIPLTLGSQLYEQATELTEMKAWNSLPIWSIELLARAETVPASVNLADVTSLLARDGSYRGRVVYTIRNRRRQFLALVLPPKLVVDSVFVADQPSRLMEATRNGRTFVLVPLPKTSEVDLSFPVTLHFSGQMDRPLPARQQLVATTCDIPAPDVLSLQDDPDYGIPVARTRWAVYLPPSLLGTPLSQLERNNLVLSDQAAAAALSGQAVLQEFDELLGCVELLSKPAKAARVPDAKESRKKQVALDNLRQLSSVLSQQDHSSDQKLREDSTVLMERYRNLDVGQQITETLQSSTPEQPITQYWIDNAGNALDGVRSNVMLNNDFLYNANGGQSEQIVTESDQDGTLWNFSPQIDANANQLGKSAQSRRALQQQNSVELESLNRNYSVKAQAQPQASQNLLRVEEFARPMVTNGTQFDSRFNTQVTTSGTTALGLVSPMFAQPYAGAQTNGGLPGGSFGGGGMAGGGFGGGMGGVVLGGNVNNTLFFDDGLVGGQGTTARGTASVKGLSLPVNLPTEGTPLILIKTGGNARLGLRLQAKESTQLVWRAVWSTGCGLVLLALLTSVWGVSRRQVWSTWGTLLGLTLIGVVLVFTTSEIVSTLGYGLFLVAVVLVMFTLARRKSTAAA